jgi:virulence factor Mce-like protein
MRRSSGSIAASPVLVGTVTTLVVVVAVFLAYHANNGLPFVPTRQLKLDVASGSNLVAGNEVREGGFRIGIVEKLRPVQLPNGTAVAEVTLKLDRTRGALPVDSRAVIRTRSALGLKYVELTRGHSNRTFADGATMPVAQAKVPVQFDEVYSTFDQRTRRASQESLAGFGDALAGRGGDLNYTIRNLPELFRHLQPVTATLADPRTALPAFFKGLNRAASAAAPVAQTQSELFTRLADTFGAFAADTNALKATISKSPSTLDVSTASLRAQRPFLRDTTAFAADLSRAAVSLRASLPDINPALEAGARVLPRTVRLDSELQGAMRALRDLAIYPGTNLALRGLNATVKTLNPQLRYYGPFQTVCDYPTFFFTFLAEHISEEDIYGFAQRALLNSGNGGTNDVNSQGAKGYANDVGPANPRGAVENLHDQGHGNAAIDRHGNADCEKGQWGYPEGRWSTFAPPGFNAVLDPHDPGNQGVTSYRGRQTGRPHVPRGETYTREPQTGPQLDPRLR